MKTKPLDDMSGLVPFCIILKMYLVLCVPRYASFRIETQSVSFWY